MFGYANGEGYQAFAAQHKFMGVRQKITLEKMGGNPQILYNDGSAKNTTWDQSTPVTTDVKSMQIKGKQTQLSWKFPLKFNVGTVVLNGQT